MTAQIKKGFTLIELLVVIAVLGVLAIVVFVAINPLQMLARTRDVGRKSAVTQLGNALGAYATSHDGNYVPTGAGTWATALVTSGEITVVPSLIAYSISGTAVCVGHQGGYCYNATAATGTAPAIVYARLESDADVKGKCALNQWGYWVWSSADGRAGRVCTAASAVPALGAQTFVD